MKTNIKICGFDFYGINYYGELRNQGWTTISIPRGADNRFSYPSSIIDIDFGNNPTSFYYCHSVENQTNYKLLPTSDYSNIYFTPVLINNATYNCPSNYTFPATLQLNILEWILNKIQLTCGNQRMNT